MNPSTLPTQGTSNLPSSRVDTVEAANPRLDTLGEQNAGARDEIQKRLGSILQADYGEGHLGRIAHYNVIDVLGHGGCGIVVKAFDERLLRPVAIKFLAPERAYDSFLRLGFIREARVAAAVRHPGVVQIHAVENEPIPYIVMEYVDGKTLHEYVDEQGAMEIEDIVDVGRQIATALAAAHDLGITHRDIKPANILLSAEEKPRVKLADFGTARTENEVSLAMSGFYAGTPTFMSPEQLCNQEVDYRTDLFSLGSVIYMMATGRSPFAAGSIMSVLNRISNKQPEPIRKLRPELPEALCQLTLRMHAKNPRNRPNSAEEIAAELMNCKAPLISRRAGGFSIRKRIFDFSGEMLRRIQRTTAKPDLNRK